MSAVVEAGERINSVNIEGLVSGVFAVDRNDPLLRRWVLLCDIILGLTRLRPAQIYR